MNCDKLSFPGLGIELDIDPVAVKIGSFEVYWYGIIIAAAMLTCFTLAVKQAKKNKFSPDLVYDLMFITLPCAIVGARIYYVIFKWDYYSQDLRRIFDTRSGGLAIYGGVIAGILVVVLLCRHKRVPIGAMLDDIVYGLLLGQIIGRWGNFMNREAFGRETTIFCRMGLTAPDGTTIYVHPTFLYESLWNLGVLLFLLWFEKKGKRRFDGHCMTLYFLLYGIGRFWIEGLRTDSLYIGSTGIRVSQALSLVLVLGAAIVLFINSRKPFSEGDLYVNRVNAPIVILPPENAAADSETEEHKEEDQHGGL